MSYNKRQWIAKAYTGTNKCYVAVPNDDGSYSHIYEEITGTTEEVSQRANLIAAAPDMLMVLQTVLSILESPEIVKLEKNGMGVLYYFESGDIEEIKQVVNKATGQG